MASTVKNFGVSSPNYFALNLERRVHSRHPIRCLTKRDLAAALSSDSAEVNGILKEVSKRASSLEFENGQKMSSIVDDKEYYEEKLEPLWDDGYGTETVKHYLDYARDMIKPDGGPTRWFTPISCGPHLRDSPVLLFLPGMDGIGLGLILHHKSLGKVFDVRCMHIPVQDRTPFEELVEWVEQTVRAEHSASPYKPIYLVGDSFGGCLALAIAARNPKIDLVVILANPATSFGRSQLHPFFPFLEALPDELYLVVPYLLSIVMGDPTKMATVNIDTATTPTTYIEHLSANLAALLPRLSGLADIIPRETLIWKLKLLRAAAAAFANSRLHAVKAEVLVLASGKDNMLPSRDEAWRLLRSSLQNCKVRYFKDNGHTILLEDGINLLTIIKGTCTYRRHSRKHDSVMDFIPLSKSEFKLAVERNGYDIVLIDETKVGVQQKLELWRDTLEARGFRLSRSKTEYMECRFSDNSDREAEMITFDGKVVHGSTFFRYLGSIIQKDGELDGDVAHRIKAGWLKWKSATGVLCDPDMPHRLNGKFYRTTIRPALLYGTECWVVKQCHVQKMNVAEMRMLRWMCGHTKKDRLRNEVIREKVRVASIEDKMMENRLRWFGHVRRRPVDAPVRRLESWGTINIVKGRGRPKKTWIKLIENDMRFLGIGESMAMERQIWKERIRVVDEI
ncbi:hypothetical protein OROGR_026789 [Orobanche gracilis]